MAAVLATVASVPITQVEVAGTSSVPAISYVGRVASGTSAGKTSGASGIVGASGVAAGNAVVVSLLLTSTSPLTGLVSATDSAGNVYGVDRDQNDGSAKDRVLILSARNVKPLVGGNTITLSFPSSAAYHFTADEFAGIGTLDRAASAFATSTPFSSGTTATTSQANELLFGVVGNESGASPTFAAGWSALPTLAISTDHLGSAFQVVNATGQYAASGGSGGTWMAAVAAYVPAGPPPPAPPTAALTVTPNPGTTGQPVTADASASTAGSSPIKSYAFSFGDNTPTVTTNAPTASTTHSYGAAGPYTVTVTVTDTAGLTATANRPVTINNPVPSGTPPTAALTVTPNPGTTGQPVTADASASTAGSSPIKNYAFSFGDNTPTVTTNAPTASTTHSYGAAGPYTITVTVTDTAGLTATTNQGVTVTGGAPSSPLAVYAGYYDTHHSGHPQPKPSPWIGSSNVVFVGNPDSSSGGWDTSAVRIDNTTGAAITGVAVTVDIGSRHFSMWGTNTIPAGGSLILAQMGSATFDGSDTNPAGCYGCSPSLCDTKVSPTVPVIHVTIGGQTTNFSDPGQVLNTHGVDSAGCPYTGTRNDESEQWKRL